MLPHALLFSFPAFPLPCPPLPSLMDFNRPFSPSSQISRASARAMPSSPLPSLAERLHCLVGPQLHRPSWAPLQPQGQCFRRPLGSSNRRTRTRARSKREPRGQGGQGHRYPLPRRRGCCPLLLPSSLRPLPCTLVFPRPRPSSRPRLRCIPGCPHRPPMSIRQRGRPGCFEVEQEEEEEGAGIEMVKVSHSPRPSGLGGVDRLPSARRRCLLARTGGVGGVRALCLCPGFRSLHNFLTT